MDAMFAEDQDPILQARTFSTCPCNQIANTHCNSNSPVKYSFKRLTKQSASKKEIIRGNAPESKTEYQQKEITKHTYTLDRKVNG